ncbi:MAG: DNA/RNA nuclease SfsA [Candidatus Heimdallarchaeaceae archaeon]
MKLTGEFFRARLIKRSNRFIAYVQLEGSQEEVKAHVPDPGRLKELLYPNAELVVRKEKQGDRKTPYTVTGVKFENIWVNIQSILSNKLFEKEYKKIPFFKHYEIIRREYSYRSSRFDFLMQNTKTSEEALVEVKSATLVKEGKALFPDAPTKRGVRHVKELREAIQEGFKSIIVFIIKREDASSLSPFTEMDPIFSKGLKSAKDQGVIILAVNCSYDPITKLELSFKDAVPVII